MINQFLTAVQLTRLTIAFGAISDMWFVILVTRADESYADVNASTMPLFWAMVAGVTAAIGLFAYGASLNDILDVRHDATFSPDRPIPAGRIRVGQAIVVTVGALILAVFAGAAFGTWGVCLTLMTAAGILFYNAAAKFIPAAGLVTLGLIHAAHMFIPNFSLTFTLPVWLIMTHVMAIAAAVHIFENKRPRLRQTSAIAAISGWLTWSAVILMVGGLTDGTLWPEDLNGLNVLFPVGAVIGFLIVARWKTYNVERTVAAEKLRRYGAMWQSMYAASWLFALELIAEGIAMFVLGVVGFFTMTMIKELTGMSGSRIEYR